jgi:hypothetical protein
VSYYIVDINPCGIKPIKQFDSYSEADLEFDDLCDRYPHAYLEILPETAITESSNA